MLQLVHCYKGRVIQFLVTDMVCFFTKISRMVLHLQQHFTHGVKRLVYKADDSQFIVPCSYTPGTVPPFPIHFKDLKRGNFTLQFYTLYSLYKISVSTQKQINFSWMSSGLVPSLQRTVSVRLLFVTVCVCSWLVFITNSSLS
jgi:hypothetical protein